MAHHLFKKLALFSLVCLSFSCAQPETEFQPSEEILSPRSVQLKLNQLASHAIKQNQKAMASGKRLETAVDLFLDAPNSAAQQNLQAAWKEAHQDYIQNQIGLFSDTKVNSALQFSLDAWPIQPGFLDSLPAYPDSGIINDVTINIDSPTLRQQHGITDREEVCLGFHALEYMLFIRPVADFILVPDPAVAPDSFLEPDLSIQRRRQLLKLVVSELNTDLTTMSERLKMQFQSEEPRDPLQQLFSLLVSTQHYLQLAFRESNFLFDPDYGHSVYSQTSKEALATELHTLQDFTLDQVALMPILKILDDTTANNYELTLRAAVKLINNPEAGESERAKLPLMLSALLHQLEEFETTLGRRIANTP